MARATVTDVTEKPDVLVLMTRSSLDDPRHADDPARFRKRLDELGFGPDADAEYINAGYASTAADGGHRSG